MPSPLVNATWSQLCLLQDASIEASHFSCNMEDNLVVPFEVVTLLEEYADIFEQPTQLPLERLGFDHKIPLKNGEAPMNQRPY